MCGIAGIFSKKRLDLDGLTTLMLNKIKHRGPDQNGQMVLNNVAFGMVRLSIVDNEKHTIPYTNENGSVILAFNGEIYNHNELRKQFKRKHAFSNDSDTESLVHAYEELGVDMFLRINGMFALAIYDRNKHQLILCRDIAGEKSVYYIENEDGLFFASEIKSLLDITDAEESKDCKSYKAFEICTGRDTLFKNIYSILPGEYLIYDGEKIERKIYWRIEDNLYSHVPDTEDEVAEELDYLIRDAIKIRTGNSVYDFGCLISGGVDSSLMSVLAKPSHLFTLTYDYGEQYDELKYAQLVANIMKQDLIVVRPTKDHFEEYRETIIYHLDYPCTWTSFNMFCVLKEASKYVKVILSGEGVDELFGGYHRYHILNHDEQIHKLPAMKNYFPLIEKYYGLPSKRYAKLINRYSDVNNEDINSYVERMTKKYFEPFDSVVHGMGHTDYYTSMQVLLHMADRMSMAHSIENRAPFLDPRLISFGFSIPPDLKIKDGITKYIFKKVASKYIPEDLAFRPDKRGFVAPINKWYKPTMNYNGRLKEFDRTFYKDMVFSDWKRVFSIK